MQGTLESSAIASLTFRKSRAAADKVGVRWFITGTQGEIAITTEEGNWQFGVPEKRRIMLKVGEEEIVDVDYLTADTGAAAKVGFPGANTARQYMGFATEGAELVTFEDALKLHKLLKRIADTAGWEL